MSRRLALASIVAISLIFTLVAAEIVLRSVGRAYQERYWRQTTSAHVASRPVITVLVLGESTTLGLWVPFEQSYPKQLEARLRAHYATNRISVVVPPHLGQNTSQMLHRFPHYLSAFHPQVVILMAGVNNSWSLAESNLSQFLPAHQWRTHVFRWRNRLDDEKVLRLFRLLGFASGESLAELSNDLAAPKYAEWPPKKSILGPVDPSGKPFLDLWRHDVGGMIDMAQQSGADVILMTYPNYDTPPREEFFAMARAKHIPLVDNYVAFRRLLAPDVAARYVFSDYRHPTAEGYAIVADHALRAMLQTPAIAAHLATAAAGSNRDQNPIHRRP